MTRACSGQLALRSVSQYRRRDALAYLGLRYYLDNEAARCDSWATDVAVDILRDRVEGGYFRVSHYKETGADGRPIHRDIFLSSANEVLAETALLGECARSEAFSNLPSVFSYALSCATIPSGVFEHYVEGIRRRHARIAEACKNCPSGIVQYTDIRKFYSSITTGSAEDAWKDRSEAARLSTRLRDLGCKLIADHRRESRGNCQGILTGPMLSHLIGNLVLRRLDLNWQGVPGVEYVRYVDDITLVGERESVERSLDLLRSQLCDMGFVLHDAESSKTCQVSAGEWLKGRNDFREDTRPFSWRQLIGDLKAFLLTNPTQASVLDSAFRRESLRLPVPDYAALARERDCGLRLRRWIQKWAHRVTIYSLIHQAKLLRTETRKEFFELAEGAAELTGYERKRRITKLRYRAGRLMYLATETELSELAKVASALPELRLHSEGMRAITTKTIDGLLPLGVNAVQSAAQALAATGSPCCLKEAVSAEQEVSYQGLAYLHFNGVPVVGSPSSPGLGETSDLLRFASSGSDRALMRSGNPYLREIACLHGLHADPRHSEMLRMPFDEEEDLVLDAVEQGYQESS